MQKFYVKCGDLSVVILGTCPINAFKKAYENYGEGKMMDDYVYMDEQGFRGRKDATYAIPIAEAMV